MSAVAVINNFLHMKSLYVNITHDPLGKDLDNDGIIDRYDNDFRDSDYFEPTYDVEDNLHTKEDKMETSSQNHEAQKKLYKRKNYSDKVYTRKKEDAPADDKTEGKKSAKNDFDQSVLKSFSILPKLRIIMPLYRQSVP